MKSVKVICTLFSRLRNVFVEVKMLNTVQSMMGTPVCTTNGECSFSGANDVDVVYVNSLHSNKQVSSIACFSRFSLKCLSTHSLCLVPQIVALA